MEDSDVQKTRKDNATVYSTSLKNSTDTIRLLRASRKWTDKLTGKAAWILEDYKLDSSTPRYIALSYHWGSKQPKKLVNINGSKFKVLDSVYAILEAIRTNPDFSPSADCCWWVDSICINQDDIPERSSQVKLMGRIYRSSYRTIGWLGNGSGVEGLEDSKFTLRGERAIQSLEILRQYRDSIVDGKEKERRAAIKRVNTLVDWKAIEEFLSRPWWRRVWTLQEYLIAPHFHFWCGKRHITRGTLKVATYALHQILHTPEYTDIISRQAWLPIWNRRRLYMWYLNTGAELPLVALVAYGSDCTATDPRDRIYSVLDLAKRGVDAGLVQPDYDRSVGEVYTNFVKEFVTKHNSLDIVCFAHIFNQHSAGSRNMTKLPSWVPDWTAAVPSYVIPTMASQSNNQRIGNFRPVNEKDISSEAATYAASGDTMAKFRFLEHPEMSILSCQGVVLDTISRSVGGTTSSRKTQRRLTPESASQILDDLAKTLVLGRENKYLSLPYTPGYYYHDLRAYCRASERSQEGVPDYFLDWYRQHKDMRLCGGFKLKDVCDLSLERPSFASLYRSIDVKAENDFYTRFQNTTLDESMGRVLIGTCEDRLCMAPARAQSGDKICVLLGCSVPLVLRPRGEMYEVIGEAYMNEFMNGEAIDMVEKGALELKWINLT